MSSGVSYSLGPILKVFVGGQPGGWNEYPVLENTFTLSSSGNTLIGFVSRFRSTGVGIVEFDSSLQQ